MAFDANSPVSIVHATDATCPEGAKRMLGDEARVRCYNGGSCPAPRKDGGVARAVWYARQVRLARGARQFRSMYFCDRCGRNFAHRHGLNVGDAK